MIFPLECTRTMKGREYHTQRCKQWECIRRCGKLITGQQEGDWRKLIGVRHPFMHITRTLTLKGAQRQDLQTVPLIKVIGGKGLHTKLLMPLKLEGTGGFVLTIWSMITAKISQGTQPSHQSALPAFKPKFTSLQLSIVYCEKLYIVAWLGRVNFSLSHVLRLSNYYFKSSVKTREINVQQQQN